MGPSSQSHQLASCLRPSTLLVITVAAIVFQVTTSDSRVVTTTPDAMTPPGSTVPPSAPPPKKPVMASNSTQTDDSLEGEKIMGKPVLMTGLILAVVAACSSVLAVIILVICIICAIRCYWDRPLKDLPFGSKPPPGGESFVPVYVDRKMAQSAQMFFYQFQKQQIIAKESEQKKRHSVDSDSCSETETKDGQANIISCPGLALNNGGDLEVRNPLFSNNATTWNASMATDDEDHHGGINTNRSVDQTDAEEDPRRHSSSVSPSFLQQPLATSSPYPPPSTPSPSSPTPSTLTPPTVATPTPQPEEGSDDDVIKRDVNENLTQISNEDKKPAAGIEPRDGSGSP